MSALARREHSRYELEQRFLSRAESEQSLAEVLELLEQQGLLSDIRFAESLARVRGARQGLRRIRYELAQKGVSETDAALAIDQLAKTEFKRLEDVWRKRFGVPPESLEQTARQQRFLQQRGFAPEMIHRFLRGVTG